MAFNSVRISRVCVCVCVCVNPCSKGCDLPSRQAGGRDTTGISRPTKRMPVSADAVGDAPLCTCSMNCCLSCPIFPFCFHGGSCHFPKTLSFAARARCCRTTADEKHFNVKTPSSLWPFHHAVPSPSFSTWELS